MFGQLSHGGFEDPDSESSRAAEVAVAELGRNSADVVVLYSSPERTVDDPAFRDAVTGTLDALPQELLARTTTYYTTGAEQLVARTGGRPTRSCSWPTATGRPPWRRSRTSWPPPA